MPCDRQHLRQHLELAAQAYGTDLRLQPGTVQPRAAANAAETAPVPAPFPAELPTAAPLEQLARPVPAS